MALLGLLSGLTTMLLGGVYVASNKNAPIPSSHLASVPTSASQLQEGSLKELPRHAWGIQTEEDILSLRSQVNEYKKTQVAFSVLLSQLDRLGLKLSQQSFVPGLKAPKVGGVAKDSTLPEIVSQLVGDINTLQTFVAAVGTAYTSLQTDYSNAQAAIQNLTINEAALNETIANYVTEVAALNGNITTLQGELADSEALVSNLTSQVQSLNNTNIEVEASLGAANSLIGELNVTIYNQTSEIATLNGQVDDLTAEVESLNATLVSTQANLTAELSDVAALQAQLTNVTAELSSAQDEISTLSGELSSTNSSLQVALVNLTEAQAEYGACEVNLTSALTEIAGLEDQIQSAVSDLNGADSIITSLTSTLEALGVIVPGPPVTPPKSTQQLFAQGKGKQSTKSSGKQSAKKTEKEVGKFGKAKSVKA